MSNENIKKKLEIGRLILVGAIIFFIVVACLYAKNHM